MSTDYRQARFLKSAADRATLPPDSGLEVAFAGRSNAGKSSVLNAIAGQRGLARTSKTPGRTQLINFFALGDELRLVDLPGYGFARVPPAVRERWRAMIEGYFTSRRSLRGLFLIMDIRRPLTPFDQQMLGWFLPSGRPVHLLLNKADKLSRGRCLATLAAVRRGLPDQVSAQIFSALTGAGIDEARAVLDSWLFNSSPNP
ncbi:MAG TPA: ribosome biogenesis GTP-binding protein YihA/YsxC [Gammaproteobacteria bacterium]|nr:ribosome biogenesis GTP-binding protein YihA/YsxC [Gammaproteobacteria bacterium]